MARREDFVRRNSGAPEITACVFGVDGVEGVLSCHLQPCGKSVSKWLLREFDMRCLHEDGWEVREDWSLTPCQEI